MGKMQRNKGATFEREVANQLETRFLVKTRRNIGQARDGGYDVPFGRFAIECKRYRSLGLIQRAMQQVKAAIRDEAGKVPVVVARADNESAVVVLPFEAFCELLELSPALLTELEQHHNGRP